MSNHLGNAAANLRKVGLPPTIFLFTLDQLSSMMNLSMNNLMVTYIFYQGRSTSLKKRHQMSAINIAPDDEKPDWRVSVEEFKAWLRRMGFKATDITYF